MSNTANKEKEPVAKKATGGKKKPRGKAKPRPKRSPSSSDIKKEAMIEALESSLGVVTTAANLAGIHRDTHYDWMKKDPEYADRVMNIENRALDFAESKLHKLIERGNVAATIFYLKTKGKNRGYVERQEHEFGQGVKIRVTRTSSAND